MNAPARFLATLGFLSRLGPARVLHEDSLSRSMFHLPLCGLVIGSAIAAPAALGLLAGRPQVQAWLAVVMLAWLTRGLHLDGLSDVADGAAAHVEPERFWSIIKDSRCGAFGVAALVLALGGQGVLFAEILRGGDWWALIWAVVFGRACAVLFGFSARAYARPGLGGLFLAGADARAAVFAALAALAPALWLKPFAALWAVAAALIALTPLRRLVTAVGGVNGDFLGAAITLGELSAALGFVLATAV
jgi:adenosylcobinamide-GDP ribazoletransferase